MAIRTANAELQKRITSAASMIGRGVNQKKPEVELEGRHQSALAHIENQILLGREYLTSAEAKHLAQLLFSTEPTPDTDTDTDTDTPDDYTADPTETNAEALAYTPAIDYDEDLEGDED
ncbi:hypothetical protein phiRKBJ001_109 [Streptomyces phage phiRKBJ001]|nr:hypothetical protein phiRKBJ001_109 [Streptomyces phage phiRKBJ001]